ncbi:uncharacterized protein METZ01_LOCUS473314 [marine metagenome]|uniref:Uncharacterized protein n=1 Tax=marine metagenome TaxID=408172 RepID=A0A383BKV9_9ZZZZ
MQNSSVNINFNREFENFKYWLAHQAEQIKDGGFPVLLRKFWKIILVIPSIPIIIIIRILRPLVTIRLGRVGMERIGNYYHIEWYLCGKDVGIYDKKNSIFSILPRLLVISIGLIF